MVSEARTLRILRIVATRSCGAPIVRTDTLKDNRSARAKFDCSLALPNLVSRHTKTDVDFFGAMRTTVGRALLALFLVLTQMHLCQTSYVRDNGESCLECGQIVEEPVKVAVAGTHGDCHDCCEIRECESPQTSSALASAPYFSLEIAILPPTLIVPKPADSGALRGEFQFLNSAPPTGPPSICLSRGPPKLLCVQPSAGCRVMSLA
jgi:hypothetical protein